MAERQPYKGSTRKLVLAFDVGTTQSGVSYSILEPGELPVFHSVTRFPGTDNVGGNHKIPSTIYYDRHGVPRSFGGEAHLESTVETAKKEKWIKAEWWKLHLRPRNMEFRHVNDQDIPPLPPDKTAVKILGDFLGYLFRCSKKYIQETHANGSAMWASFGENIDFVLSHPNGWEGQQQAQIRRAAVLARLVPDSSKGQKRIRLVTEGEASLQFCLSFQKTAGSFKEGEGAMIIDAGGGTIDISSYSMTKSPSTFKEIAPTECRMHGAVFVTRRAERFLTSKQGKRDALIELMIALEKLAQSKFGSKEDIAHIASVFDKTAKLGFRNPSEPSFVHFGAARDRDPAFGIKNGQLIIPGVDVATFFEPSIREIIEAVENQRKTATQPINSIFLVGGFASNNWLFSKLQEYVKMSGLNFCRPDGNTGKAVANGALEFYFRRRVSARVSKFTYGIRSCRDFDKNDEQHRRRAASVGTYASGRKYVPGAFSAILPKGTTVSETKEFRQDFSEEGKEKAWDTVTTSILCYRGHSTDPRWVDSEPKMFTKLCTIHADTSKLSKTLSPRYGLAGARFYEIKYSIVLKFGLTELEAQISWKENGKEKRGPATIVFDPV